MLMFNLQLGGTSIRQSRIAEPVLPTGRIDFGMNAENRITTDMNNFHGTAYCYRIVLQQPIQDNSQVSANWEIIILLIIAEAYVYIRRRMLAA